MPFMKVVFQLSGTARQLPTKVNNNNNNNILLGQSEFLVLLSFLQKRLMLWKGNFLRTLRGDKSFHRAMTNVLTKTVKGLEDRVNTVVTREPHKVINQNVN